MTEPEESQTPPEDQSPASDAAPPYASTNNSTENTRTEDKPVIPDTLTPFVEYLSEVCSEEDRFSQFRAAPGGLFIASEYLANTLELYIEWAKKTQNNTLNNDKAQRKLFGDTAPALSYLLDGKTTLTGYLAPFVAEGTLSPSKKIKLPYFQGSFIDASDYLHMRDPIFDQLDGVHAVVGSGGFTMKFSNESSGDILLTQDSLKQFAQVLRSSPFLLKKHPAVQQALRNVLKIFAHAWKTASPSKHKTLVPPAFRKTGTSNIFKWGEIILVRDTDSKLAFCYGLKGKNFRGLVSREVSKISRNSNKVRIKHSRLSKQKGIFMTVDTSRDQLRIPERVVKEFVEHATQIEEARNALPERYTAKDAVDLLADFLFGSRWVEDHGIPKQFLQHGHTYRKRDAFIFTFGKNFTLERIHHPALSQRERGKAPDHSKRKKK